MKVQHPWQSGPTELICYAIDHLHCSSEFDQRIAFLLLDIGIETLFKTFLQLPDEVTRTKLSYTERKKASEGSFHELIRGIQKAADSRLDGIDLTHIQFYHDLRNKLYHQGNGITIPTEKAKNYASIAVEILQRLLGINLQMELMRPQQELSGKNEQIAMIEQIEQRKDSLKQKIHFLDQNLHLAIEKVEPTFVLPSFAASFEQWQTPSFLKLNTWLQTNRNNIDEKGYLKWPPDLISEVCQLMPDKIQQFIDKHKITYDPIVKIIQGDILDFLLIVADIAFKLPTDPSDNIYNMTKLFLGSEPYHPRGPYAEIDNPLEYMLEEGDECLAKMDELIKAVTSIRNN